MAVNLGTVMNSVRPLTRIVVFLFLCSVAISAENNFDSALRRLSQSGLFAFGPVGYPGHITVEERSYWFLVKLAPSLALPTFERIYAGGTPEAKAYALCGMRRLNPERFKELLVEVRSSKLTVEVARGCIGSQEPLPELAKEIERGEFIFLFP